MKIIDAKTDAQARKLKKKPKTNPRGHGIREQNWKALILIKICLCVEQSSVLQFWSFSSFDSKVRDRDICESDKISRGLPERYLPGNNNQISGYQLRYLDISIDIQISYFGHDGPPYSNTMAAVYDWIGSLSLVPENFELLSQPGIVVSPAEPVTVVDRTTINMTSSNSTPNMADDSDIQFRGFGDLPEVGDTILEPVPENIPDELLVGDEQSRYEGFGPFHWYATVRTVCRSYKKKRVT